MIGSRITGCACPPAFFSPLEPAPLNALSDERPSVLRGVLRTGIPRRDVLTRDAATGDLGLELVGGTILAGERLDGDEHLRELAGSTRLLLVGVLDLVDHALDGLLVSHLRLADVGLDLELALHAVDED